MTTYLLLTVVVLALVSGATVPVLRWLPALPVLWTAAGLVLMTAIFDSAIVGFGLTVYDPDKILGLYVGAAPIEDFGYTVAAIMLMPVLWTVLGRWRRRAPERAPGGSAARAGEEPDGS